MRLLLSVIFVCMGIGATRAQTTTVIDTVLHSNGQIGLLVYQREVTLAELTRPERFMRNLTEAAPDTKVTQVDSTVAYDTYARRIPLFHPLARALVKELGRGGREVPQPSEADKRHTPLGHGLEIAWPRATYYGRLASQHSDTLRITNLLPRGRTVRLKAPLHLSLPDNVAVPPRVGTSPVPFVLRFEEPEQSVSLTIQLPNDSAFHHRLTLYGYDIGNEQLTDRSSSAQTFHLRSRKTLYLHLPDTEKLLLIYRGHRLIDRLPIGRQRDVVDLTQYRRGRYLLEFVDLAGHRSRYAWLRLGR